MGTYLTKLETGQGLNQHRDYRNHEKYLNYTINFGLYEGGHLEVLRGEEWESCAVPLMWIDFTADIIHHRVREVTKGTRFSVTLFTPSHLERLTPEDWMNLESFGFPVQLYSEMDSDQAPWSRGKAPEETEGTLHGQSSMTLDVRKEPSMVPALASTEAQAVEKHSRAHEDPLATLSGQVPLPNAGMLAQEQLALAACALLTRDFNGAMGLPKGELPKCVDKEHGAVYGRMLREEVQEIEDAVQGGLLHEVLAESVDVLYLTFNLLQECGLEKAIESAFLLKREDNMKKQHETVAHLAWSHVHVPISHFLHGDILHHLVRAFRRGKVTVDLTHLPLMHPQESRRKIWV